MVNVIRAGESSPMEIATDVDALVGRVGVPYAMHGAYDAAKKFDRDLAGWNPPLQSADLDLLPEKEIMDARTRDAFRNDAYVQGGQTLYQDGIVGSFYFLNAKPDLSVLSELDPEFFTEKWAEEFQTEVEAKFTLWAQSPMKWVDAARKNDFTATIRLAVGVYSAGGEVLATGEWLRDGPREFNTAIQMVDCDRLSTPYDQMWNPLVKGGIRMNQFGAPQTAYIRVRHPHDYQVWQGSTEEWKEVVWRKPWGRQQVLYIAEQMRVDQTRAVADIVAGLKEIAITRKFRDVTLQRAVTQAMYAASIESELPPEAVYAQMGAGGSIGDAIAQYGVEFLTAVSEYMGESKNTRLDGVRIPHFFPGTKLNLHSVNQSNGIGQDFETSLLRYIAAALGVSYEELSRDYTKTNYSSARAAMLNTWRRMQSRKKIVADEMANFIFRLWLEEAIGKGVLRTFPREKMGLLYTGPVAAGGVHNLAFEALCVADWIGAARGQIDELKETQAAVLRIKFGLSTHEDELARLGKDWRKVYQQLERERKEREARGIELQEDNSVNAASGSVREKDEGEKDDGEQRAAA